MSEDFRYSCDACKEEYYKMRKKQIEQSDINKIFKEILALRDKSEENENSNNFETEYACYTRCLHIIGNYLEVDLSNWEEVGYRDKDGYLVLPKNFD